MKRHNDMAERNDKEIRLLFLEFIFYIILDILDYMIGQIIMLAVVFLTLTVHIIYKDVIKKDIRMVIKLLEKYEGIKNDKEKERECTKKLGLAFPSLVNTNLDLTFPSDKQPDSLKNDKYTVGWSPIGKNPTTRFFIRRMENKMNAVKPEEAFYSQIYLRTNPDKFTDKSVKILKDFIEYIKKTSK